MSDYRLSEHAKEQAALRGIPLDLIGDVLTNPDKIEHQGDGKYILQGKVNLRGRDWLLRVVVGTDTEPTVVVTVYLTRLGRYGS